MQAERKRIRKELFRFFLLLKPVTRNKRNGKRGKTLLLESTANNLLIDAQKRTSRRERGRVLKKFVHAANKEEKEEKNRFL
jgi:hypothetical protein